jgi:hypothetical protein
MTTENETYLGDGLYASFDGYHFKLRAPRFGADHEVFLELEVVKNFQEYVQHIARELTGVKSS